MPPRSSNWQHNRRSDLSQNRAPVHFLGELATYPLVLLELRYLDGAIVEFINRWRMAQSMFCSSELEHETHSGPGLDNVIDKSIITAIDAHTTIAGGHRERNVEVIANASHDIPHELG
jgi:hypothetical protein